MTRTGSWLRATAAAVLVLPAGCNTDDVVFSPGTGSAEITVSNAHPLNGNGALDPVTADVEYFIDQTILDLDKVTIEAHGDGGAILHNFEILWVPTTGEVKQVLHFWSPVAGGDSGATRCPSTVASVCDPAQVSVSPLAQAIFCKGLVLHDASGATSTVTGTILWENEGGLDGGDH